MKQYQYISKQDIECRLNENTQNFVDIIAEKRTNLQQTITASHLSNWLKQTLFLLCISTSVITTDALAVQAIANNEQQLGYYRDPTLHGNNLVFTAQGDLWSTSLNSSAPAKRLTSHANLERSAEFSPSGDKIAFVASYNNVSAVHVINARGGKARQVSFELASSKLHGWVNENTLLISTASDTGMHSSWVLKTIDIIDLSTKSLPVFDAVEGTVTQDGETLVFIQYGLQMSTDNANHYKGGAAGEMWRFTLDSNKEASLLTSKHEGSVRTPMLYEQTGASRIYFISNQNGLDNIWSMALNGNDIKQHTMFTDWAVRSASIHEEFISFQHGADIKIFNIKTGNVSSVDISLQSDFVDLRTRHIKDPLSYFNSASISPTGNNAVVVARGRIGIANTQSTRFINVATDPTSRNRSAIMSKDGHFVYAISDVTGDYEIWQFDAKGNDSAKQLTQNGSELKTDLWLSPNGEWLAYTEKSGKLWLLELSSGKSTVANESLNGEITDIEFSHDSAYLAATFTEQGKPRSNIYLQEVPNGKSAMLTGPKYDSGSPAFSTDMHWLYFLSDRSFTPTPSSPWGDRNMGTAFDKRTQIFAIALTKNAKFPFAAPTELNIVKDTVDDNDSDTKNKENDKEKVLVDFDNIEKRLWQVNLPAGDYDHLEANEKALFILEGNTLKSLEFRHDAKIKEMTGEVNNINLSGDKKHLLVTKGSRDKTKLLIVPANADYPSDLSKHNVNLSDWTIVLQPQQEWQQLFKDAWLMHRDSLFDKNMRGLDWPATKQKYAPLVARMTERSELNDIFEQMMGELNTLHSQVRGGDVNDDPNAPAYATLGASYTDTPNGVLINTIYQYDFELISQAPPLAKPGVNAQVGDIITAVNNRPIATVAQLQKALVNTAGQQTLLSLTRSENRNDVQIQTVVKPTRINREARLRYQNWVANNLAKVQSHNADVGYLHLYAMGANDIASFARDFYAQYEKKGLIIDVRRNRGGNIDSLLIEKLLRRAWSFWESPQLTQTNMQQTFRGHLVVLADQFTYSDGETFTAGIKSLGIGTVIGKQTAGAGVWLSGNNRLVDGGMARVAEFPVFTIEGDWLAEGRGISPDIEVDNLPHATYKGNDAQLQAALALLAKKIKESPVRPLKGKGFPGVEESASDAKLITK
ncbi:MAG: tricorn protease [Gammaproteobacteria bacterium]|jgi:tricorn protease